MPPQAFPPTLRKEDAEKASPEALFATLASSAARGLSRDEAARRLEHYGPNALEEKRVSPLRKFLGYFWGPIPWMIEAAAILSALIGHWADLVIILVLLVFNAGVGFWEEYQAGNAIEQLKKTLALKARVLRDGQWGEIDADRLVPGDVVRLHLGMIVPADIKLSGGDYLSIDQSALTGESLPVDKKVGDIAYSSSVVKQGAMVGLVIATGMNTFFGTTARLVGEAGHVSHFQRAVTTIGRYLIYMSLGLVAVLVAEETYRATPFFRVVEFALILTVASIPVAMPAVLSVTMAVGARLLSKMKAIVSRLDSIEEMAGMDILCSDKTGTLTQNRLTLGTPVCFDDAQAEELVLAGALASPLDDRDQIDTAVVGGLADPRALARYTQKSFMPFDPVHKRTEAEVSDETGRAFKVSKGAPQVILTMAAPDEALRRQVMQQVDAFARQGNRTLGVARSEDGEHWRFLGLLPLADPPREDAREVIEQARRHGLTVKMVTGDNIAIGRQIAAEVGLGANILAATALIEDPGKGTLDAASIRKIDEADGFAEVAPEHKFQIVKALQTEGRDHVVGMTGDGVNDAPALSQAEVGIAVSGATDAARSAAALVLTEPGLGVIIRAVEEARRIFERMNSYAIYRITETIRIMIFVVLTIVFYAFYPISTVMIILLALLNDLPIMTIAYDNTWLSPVPVRWQMRRVLAVASTLGVIGVIETFVLLVIAIRFFGLGKEQLQSLIFLKLAVAGHLTLMVARTKRRFFQRPYPSPILLSAVLVTQIAAALIVGFGVYVAKIPWAAIGWVWAYALAWLLVEDEAKLLVYRYLDGARSSGRERRDEVGRPRAAAAVAFGSLTEIFGGVVAVIPVTLGLSHIFPAFMPAVAAIVIGAALTCEGGSIVAQFLRNLRAGRHSPLPSVWMGGGTQMAAGIVGLGLGVLALAGSDPVSACGSAVIVYGAVLALRGSVLLRIGDAGSPRVHKGLLLTAGVAFQSLAGLAAVVMGILAVTGIVPALLIPVGLLSVAAAFALAGGVIGPRLVRLLRVGVP